MQRDAEVNLQLKEIGYTVFRFWEHEIKKDLEKCVNDIMVFISVGYNN